MTSAVFLGTPRAAVPVLMALAEIADVPLVVTRADKPRGRSRRLQPPPVKETAEELGLAVAQPTTSEGLLDSIAAVAPDVAVVAAYGRIIKPELLAVPEHGFVNLHYSLLPRWRGASPVHRTILAGDAETGVTLMQMDEGLDTGPVIAWERMIVGDGDTTGSLTARLADAAGDLLRARLPDYLAGDLEPVPQDDAAATAAAKVTQEEAHLDPLRHPAQAIDRAVRAFDPAPGAWCDFEGDRFKVWRVAIGELPDLEPGLVESTSDGVLLGVRDGTIRLVEVQPSGRPRMEAEAWMNGRRGEPARLT